MKDQLIAQAETLTGTLTGTDAQISFAISLIREYVFDRSKYTEQDDIDILSALSEEKIGNVIYMLKKNPLDMVDFNAEKARAKKLGYWVV